MGSGMKKSIFHEQTSKALKKWRDTVKKKRVLQRALATTQTLGGGSNAGRSLRRLKTTGHSVRVSTYEDLESSDYEGDILATSTPELEANNVDVEGSEIHPVVETNQPHRVEHTKEEGDELSFVKPAPAPPK